MKSDYVYEIDSTSQEGYCPDEYWKSRAIETGIICRLCKSIRPGTSRDIDEIVLQNRSTPRTHVGSIAGFRESLVISDELHDALSRAIDTDIASLFDRKSVKLLNSQGKQLLGVRCYLFDENDISAIVRGPLEPQPLLCELCHKLCYWPGWPPSEWQVLRRDWLRVAPLWNMGDNLICSPWIWTEFVRPVQLKKVVAHRFRLVEEPTDGHPADLSELKAALLAKKIFSEDYYKS